METLLNILNEVKSISYTKSETNTAISNSKVQWISSGTSNTTTWVGNASNLSSLTAGTLIVYYLNHNSVQGNINLSLVLKNGDTEPQNGEGKPIKFADGTLLEGGTYKKGDVFLLLNTNNHWLVISYASSKDLKITIDNALDANSNNPLTNKKITNEITNLQTNINNSKIAYVASTQSSVTNEWEGTTNQLSSITSGTIIAFLLNKNSNGDPVTLKLTLNNGNQTDANPVQYYGTQVTNEHKKGDILLLVYTSTHWLVVGSKNEAIINEDSDLVIDDSLSSSSMNPISNRSVYNALESLRTEILGDIGRETEYNVELTTSGTTNSSYTGDTEIVLNQEGMVTHTATITDNENNSVGKGIIVDFYRNNELFGSSTTNSSGVATFRSIYQNGTYNILAQVKEFGQINRIHIVNSYNRLPLAIQSGGDIEGLENLTSDSYARGSSIQSGNFTSSSEWSSNGSNSLKITTAAPGTSAYIRLRVPIETEDIGKTVTVKAKAHIPQGSGILFLIFHDSQTEQSIVKQQVDIPSHYTVPLEITGDIISETTDYVFIQFRLGNCETMYLDDIECYFD